MSQIPCVSGFIYDENSNPVADADLDFDDAVTGERINTPDDNSDESGFYRVCVLPGTYHISFAPPPMTHLLGQKIYNVQLDLGDDIEMDVTLDSGVAIHGLITGESGEIVGLVDIDADDLPTNTRIFTPNDNSDTLTGEYWIVVPPSLYRLRFQPPRGTRYLAVQLDTVVVAADTEINLVLEEGLLISGFIFDSNETGLDEIGIDMRNPATGDKIYLANDETDSTGYYITAFPGGLTNLRFEPPLGSRFIGVAFDSVTLVTDTVFNQILDQGYLVSFEVTDSSGNSLAGADIDFINNATAEKIYLPHDRTDTSGATIVSVAAGNYDIRIDPPLGSIYDRFVIDNIDIAGDTSLQAILPEVERVQLSGRVVDHSGTGIEYVTVDFVDIVSSNKVYITQNFTNSTGHYNLAVPTGSFDVEFAPLYGSRFVGVKLPDVIINGDTSFSDIVLDTGMVFMASVYDRSGAPMADVDFDFISEPDSLEILTPYDNTDSLGNAEIVAPAGLYSIRLTPPVNSDHNRFMMSGFNFANDTSYVFFMRDNQEILPESFRLGENYPNPFNSYTLISYTLFEQEDVTITIYNMLGQQVRRFDLGLQPPGFYNFRWGDNDNKEMNLASGVYYYKLSVPSLSVTKNMLLIK